MRSKMFEPLEDQFKEPTQSTNTGQLSSRGADQSQLDFELKFFERILDQSPDYVDVLRVHADNLTSKGQYAAGLAADRRLARLRPNDPAVHYNLACSYSLLHMIDAAIAALDSSLRLGYRNVEHLLKDPDLEHIRRDARFVGLLGRYLLKSKASGRAK